jgi:type I restriction enzyme S subunit
MSLWKKIRLGDACTTNASTYSPKDKWLYVNYLDTGNIVDNKIDSIQYIDIEKEKLPSRARRKVRKNSIIYSTVRPNQRHFGIIKSQPNNFLVSTGFTVIDVNSGILDAEFLYYRLSQNDLVETLHSIAEQSTSAYPSIKASDIENLEIDVPDIDTQVSIGRFLSNLDGKIRCNEEINDNFSGLDFDVGNIDFTRH